eukprot:sb/3476039/
MSSLRTAQTEVDSLFQLQGGIVITSLPCCAVCPFAVCPFAVCPFAARVSSHRAFGPVRELSDVEHVNYQEREREREREKERERERSANWHLPPCRRSSYTAWKWYNITNLADIMVIEKKK